LSGSLSSCRHPALRGAEWVTHSGDNQRTGWQKNETAISKDSVKNLKLLWKITLDTKQRSVFPVVR
jgi:hypothetical protein